MYVTVYMIPDVSLDLRHCLHSSADIGSFLIKDYKIKKKKKIKHGFEKLNQKDPTQN